MNKQHIIPYNKIKDSNSCMFENVKDIILKKLTNVTNIVIIIMKKKIIALHII